MKRMDDQKKGHAIDQYIDDIESVDKYILKYHTAHIEMPKRFMYYSLKKTKFWEAEDISDIINNYDMISRLEEAFTPLEHAEILNYMRNNLIIEYPESPGANPDPVNMRVQEEINKSAEQYHAYQYAIREYKNYTNKNIVSLDNIYLGDFLMIKEAHYDWCKINVRDMKENNIPAGVYFHRNSDNIELKKELDAVRKYKPYSQPFDITFTAIPCEEKIKAYMLSGRRILEVDFGSIFHEPMLNIRSISKSDGDKAKILPIGSSTFSPVYA